MCVLSVGDLTQQGYERKLARLETKYCMPDTVTIQPASTVTTQPASKLAESLANPEPSIRQQIRKLYGRSQEQGSSSSGFNPSAVGNNPRKKKSLLPKKERVVAICVPEGVYTLPKRKRRDQLIEEGRVKEVTFEKEATEDEILELLTQLFPHTPSSGFQFLKVVKASHDLIPAEVPGGHTNWDGTVVLSLVENGSIYVKPKPSAATSADAPCDNGPCAKPTSQMTSSSTSQTVGGPPTSHTARRPLASKTALIAPTTTTFQAVGVSQVAHGSSTSQTGGRPPVSKAARIAPTTVTTGTSPVCQMASGPPTSQNSLPMTKGGSSTSQPYSGATGSFPQNQPFIQHAPQYVVGPRVFAVVLGQNQASTSNQSGEKVFDKGIVLILNLYKPCMSYQNLHENFGLLNPVVQHLGSLPLTLH